MLFTAACSTTDLADPELCPLEDPFTGEGYCVKALSQTERVIPKDIWIKERRTYILMSPKSWAEIKNKHYKDCYTFECKQTLENVDQIFIEIDKAVKQAIDAGILK